MQQPCDIYDRLRPIQNRMRYVSVLQSAAQSLIAGSILAALLAVFRRFGIQVSWLTVAAIPLVMMGFAMLICSLRKPAWTDVARRTDQAYGLKDRALSAVYFCEDSTSDPLQHLQIRDALDHLDRINARQVVPTLTPRSLPLALILLVGAWALLILPVASKQANATPDPPADHLVRLAEQLEEEVLASLKEAKNESGRELNPKDQSAIDDLAADLAKMVDQIKLPGVDSREALAKLSDMQSRIVEVQQQLDLAKIDPYMLEIGQALQQANATRMAGRALEELEYESAAKQLDEFQPEQVSASERDALAAEMAELSKEMAAHDQDQLAAAARELATSMKDDDDSTTEAQQANQKSSVSKLANLARQLASRKALARNLAQQKAKLNQAKGVARSGGTSRMPTKRPRSTWGRGTSPESLTDQATEDLQSQRQREVVSGIAGEGPSERSTVESTETVEGKRLEYVQKYQQFERAAESVLESEQLPLGHRQTIRDYFDAIRPE